MQLEPYLFFHGKCGEALETYKTIFGGTADVMRMGDSPMAEKLPPEQHDLVMHASFVAEGVRFMASDGDPAGSSVADGNISLSLSMHDRKEADRLFAALSDGGSVDQPMSEQFWGAYFGTCTDRYGIDWMINCQERQA